MPVKYRRVLLKLSGESLAGSARQGIDPNTIAAVAEELKEVHQLGVQLGTVVGGGNIFRGLAAAVKGMDRSTADQMGMMATAINALALQDSLEAISVPCRVLSALEIKGVAEAYSRRRAISSLEGGELVIFAAGTGHPYFTTDTAAALRACEIGANALLKATRVEGVFSTDPEIDSQATLYKTISYTEALERNLRIMDSTAFALCRENRMPIVVFKMDGNNLVRLIQGDDVGSTVKETS